MPGDPQDQELLAIQAIMSALGDLDREARSRVIEYVFRRLGVSSSAVAVADVAKVEIGAAIPQSSSASRVVDIKTLTEEKKPRNALEMAALVAYYLSELAPPAERQAAIGTPEIERYFKQARFPMPNVRYTLPNAKNAGYFEQVERGRYKLTPVGYNLVVHALAAGGTKSEVRPTRRRRSRGKTKRPAKPTR